MIRQPMIRQLYYGEIEYALVEEGFARVMEGLKAVLEDHREFTHQLGGFIIDRGETSLSGVLQVWRLDGIKVVYSSQYTVPTQLHYSNIMLKGVGRIHLNVPDDKAAEIGEEGIEQVARDILEGMKFVIPDMPAKECKYSR